MRIKIALFKPLFLIPPNGTRRKIAVFLLRHDLCTFNEIVYHINKAPSTVSWHLRRLRDAGILSIKYGENHHLYRVADGDIIAIILYKYKAL